MTHRPTRRAQRHRLQVWTDDLAWMAAWREVLEWKFNSPQHHFEPAHLEAELQSFKRVSAGLGDSYRSPSYHSDRRAA
jgi:hypothetical protein